jgi:hypothetical protein
LIPQFQRHFNPFSQGSDTFVEDLSDDLDEVENKRKYGEDSLSYFGREYPIKSPKSPSSKFQADSGSTQNLENEWKSDPESKSSKQKRKIELSKIKAVSPSNHKAIEVQRQEKRLDLPQSKEDFAPQVFETFRLLAQRRNSLDKEEAENPSK